MARAAAYDEIADWYEREFLGRQADEDPLGIRQALASLLGAGRGTCLEIGCGTGVHAATIRELGWTPVGMDLSGGMLRHARDRLPVARGTPPVYRSVTASWTP
jgi:predicted TPR repeat methyltransferase